MKRLIGIWLDFVEVNIYGYKKCGKEKDEPKIERILIKKINIKVYNDTRTARRRLASGREEKCVEIFAMDENLIKIFITLSSRKYFNCLLSFSSSFFWSVCFRMHNVLLCFLLHLVLSLLRYTVVILFHFVWNWFSSLSAVLVNRCNSFALLFPRMKK